jgi:hypothetical protein
MHASPRLEQEIVIILGQAGVLVERNGLYCITRVGSIDLAFKPNITEDRAIPTTSFGEALVGPGILFDRGSNIRAIAR